MHVRIASDADTSSACLPEVDGISMLSVRPANHAAGNIRSARPNMASIPARQPNPVVEVWASGAATNAPSDPTPVMTPSTMLRIEAGTERAATACAVDAVVPASAAPINSPALSRMLVMPCADASSASPAR